MAKTTSKSSKKKKSSKRVANKRAMWTGAISFGLVNVPVKLYTTYSDQPLSFSMLCSDCSGPLQYKRWCDSCEKEVQWADIVKGYKIAKEEYVIITKEELENVNVSSNKQIDISEFVASYSIDPVYFDKSYYVIPDEGSESAFYLLLQTMEDLERSAIAKITFRNKEHLVILRPYNGLFLLTVLHYAKEIVDAKKMVSSIDVEKPSKEELKLARQLVENMTKDLHLEKYENEYKRAVEELIEAKRSGKKVKLKKKDVKKAKSLISALKQSVEKSK